MSLDGFVQIQKKLKPEPEPKPKKKSEARSNVVIEDVSEVKREHTHAYVNLKYASETTLEKRMEVILYDYGYSIRPYPQASSRYGGYWGSGGRFDKEDLDQLFAYLIKWKRGLFDKPYTDDDLTNAHRFSNLKPEHVYINVSEKTRRWIDRNTQTSWDDFLRDWDAVDIAPTPEGYVDLVCREEELGRQSDDIREAIGKLQGDIRKTDFDSLESVKKVVGGLRELEELIPMRFELEGQLECVREEIEEMVR